MLSNFLIETLFLKDGGSTFSIILIEYLVYWATGLWTVWTLDLAAVKGMHVCGKSTDAPRQTLPLDSPYPGDSQ